MIAATPIDGGVPSSAQVPEDRQADDEQQHGLASGHRLTILPRFTVHCKLDGLAVLWVRHRLLLRFLSAMLVKEDLVRELHAVLAGVEGLRLALLFGSQARGQAGEHSDVDVAVDAPDADLLELGARISERVGTEVDVVSLGSAPIPLLERLLLESIPVYEATHGTAAAWRARVLAQLETDRPWYRRMRVAWLGRVAREGLSGG